MPGNRRSPRDEEPKEEFINDGYKTDEANEEPKSNSPNYEELSLKELQQKADKENIAGCKKMNRDELIHNLKDISL